MKKNMILLMSLVLFITLCSREIGEASEEAPESNSSISHETECTIESTVESTVEMQAIDPDWDIVTREGHPRFNDSEELARKVWGDVSEKKILFADSYNRYSKTNIITMDSLNGRLNSIEVYFQNFSTPTYLAVDDILAVVSSYLPVDQMKGHYEADKTFIAIPNEGKDADTHYFVRYIMKDDARDKNPDLFYDVVVEIQVRDGYVTMFRVFHSLPNWTRKLEFNGYSEQVWDYDFLTE